MCLKTGRKAPLNRLNLAKAIGDDQLVLGVVPPEARYGQRPDTQLIQSILFKQLKFSEEIEVIHQEIAGFMLVTRPSRDKWQSRAILQMGPFT